MPSLGLFLLDMSSAGEATEIPLHNLCTNLIIPTVQGLVYVLPAFFFLFVDHRLLSGDPRASLVAP